MTPPPNIVLLGFTGAGKSTVGAILAEKLGRVHFDLDAVLEGQVGSLPAFAAAQGVAAFRRLEYDTVAGQMPRRGVVVSTGAGSILPAATRQLLCQGAHCFFLDVPPPVVVERLERLPPEERHRPDLLQGDALAQVTAELHRRRPLYLRLGHRLDATAAPAVVAATIIDHLADD